MTKKMKEVEKKQVIDKMNRNKGEMKKGERKNYRKTW